MRFKTLSVAALFVVLMTLPVLAHHSHGNYLMTEYIQIEGTVTEIHWINPHSWIYMDVADEDGESAVWALEGANVASLRRRGWAEDSISAGDRISARCHQLRDGSNGCLLGYLTTEGGEEKLFD
jgi:hypothetical protein